MELHPEKSSGKVNESTGLPEKDTTQVTTNLTVRSGATIVIGGLIEEQQQRSVQQIPFLGSLPVVGHIFRDETTTISRNEIIVLITPTIIDDEEEYTRACSDVARFSDRRQSLEESFPKYTRVALARKYVQLACDYRDQGDIPKALEMIDLALHFDPTSNEALQLRRSLRYLDGPAEIPLQNGADTTRAGQPLLLYPVSHPDRISR
jgi:hypothetical protein